MEIHHLFNVQIQNPKKVTLLSSHTVGAQNTVSCCFYIVLCRGADPNIENDAGLTVLDFAYFYKNQKKTLEAVMDLTILRNTWRNTLLGVEENNETKEQKKQI